MGVGRTVIHMNKIRNEINQSNWNAYNGMPIMGHRFSYGQIENERGLFIPFSSDNYQKVYRRTK
ncbi:MAG TPA: hypothetical protein VJ917_04270, partial [Saprospiraceae bacterium]|nr:hypothetical protein [Saprospiraceae bacterium]